MARPPRLNTVLAGVAGEYFVAGELSRLGYVASLTLKNTKGVDVLASNQDASVTVGIQVKTNQGTAREWVLNQKAESFMAPSLFYVFVTLGRGVPEFFVVPSQAVAKYSQDHHLAWLRTPGKKGQPHKDNPMRKFRDPESLYRDRWDLLGLG